MKKSWIIAACILIAAVIAAVMLLNGRNDAERRYEAASAEVTRLQAEAEAAQAEKEALTRAQDDAQAQHDEALKAAEDKLSQLQSESEAALAAVRAESEEALRQCKAEAEAKLTAAQAELERTAAALDEARREAATATAAAIRAGAPYAYLFYANGDWGTSYWGTDAEGVNCKAAAMLDDGSYSVALTLDAPAEGLGFLSLCVKDGEKAYPGGAVRINAILVNGEEIPFTKGYTVTDDNVDFRVNLYNDAGSLTPPAGARSYDGDLNGASSVMVDRDAFAAMQTLEVYFDLVAAP